MFIQDVRIYLTYVVKCCVCCYPEQAIFRLFYLEPLLKNEPGIRLLVVLLGFINNFSIAQNYIVRCSPKKIEQNDLVTRLLLDICPLYKILFHFFTFDFDLHLFKFKTPFELVLEFGTDVNCKINLKTKNKFHFVIKAKTKTNMKIEFKTNS